jgi:hypothetical protein
MEGLAEPDAVNFTRHYYLVENIALVKSCLILVDFENDDLLIRFFNKFFDLGANQLSSRVEFHILEIMNSLIVESQSISPRLLDTILLHLVSPLKACFLVVLFLYSRWLFSLLFLLSLSFAG